MSAFKLHAGLEAAGPDPQDVFLEAIVAQLKRFGKGSDAVELHHCTVCRHIQDLGVERRPAAIQDDDRLASRSPPDGVAAIRLKICLPAFVDHRNNPSVLLGATRNMIKSFRNKVIYQVIAC